MTGKAFFKAVVNGRTDILGQFLALLGTTKSKYRAIGGLAVNAYAEPVVSLDLDIVVAADKLASICSAALKRNFRIKAFEHSLNLEREGSDLRVLLQTDVRYQGFLSQARVKKVLGYRLKVASVEDVLKGKSWAYQDEKRRASKRQKDLADIARLIEEHPGMRRRIPQDIKKALN